MNLKDRNSNMKEFFNRKIDGYDEIHLKMMDNKNAIASSLKENTTKVLDLGAGTGLELIPLFKRFPNVKVTAIDITENMLDELKKRNFAYNVECICSDFFEVDFGNDYDAVISSAALHHFTEDDKEKLFNKIYNSLKVGGQFVNSDRYVVTQEEQEQLMKEYEENPNLHPHMDTPLTLQNEKIILEKVGFKNVVSYELDDERYKLMVAEK